MPRRRGSLVAAVLGGLLGVVAGLAAYSLAWMLIGDPRVSPADRVANGSWGPLLVDAMLGGAAAGFVLVGRLAKNPLATRLSHSAGRLLRLGFWMLVGAVLGGVVALFVVGVDTDWTQTARDTVAGALDPAAATFPYTTGGAFAGLVVAVAGMGWTAVRSALRFSFGGLVGATAGLVIYSVAYVLVRNPMADPQVDMLRLGEAVWSLTAIELLFVALAAGVGALLSRYTWRLHGVLTFVALLFVILGYILYTVTTTLPRVPPEGQLVSRILFAAELTSLSMVLLYSFYTLDVASRKKWRRTVQDAPFSAYYLPKVAFHVPTYNEPAELVIATLQTLLAMDYPQDRMCILVGDDSTRAESATPISEFCAAHGITYVHRDDRRGYKAGALNGLLSRTPGDTALIAVIDADYQVQPNFLRETVGHFIDPGLAWVQTPQDYRNRHQGFLTEQYYLADAYFYRTILPSRNEENSIIFCGTMGLLRASALRSVGGWGESHITEDAELSVRLLHEGWRSLYINKTYGRGLIPATFEGYKKQHYRWAFGGGRVLRAHGWRLLFGRYTFRQRLDYLLGAVNWFEGVFVFAIACVVLGMGVADLNGSTVVTHHRSEIVLVGLVPILLLLDGLTRVHLVLRRTVHLGFGGTIRILGMWSSVKFSNMRAALKGLVGFTMPFVRTQKQTPKRLTRLRAAAHATRLTPFESLMAVLLATTCAGVLARTLSGDAGSLVGLPSRLLLAFWLAYYALVFAAAPIYAYKSFSTLGRDRDAVASRATTDVTA